MISTSGHLIPKFPEVRFHRTRIFKELPYYNGHKSVHFIVAKGYDWDMNGSASYSTVKINDPNYSNAYYGGNKSCSWTKMTKALKATNGWYIMAK